MAIWLSGLLQPLRLTAWMRRLGLPATDLGASPAAQLPETIEPTVPLRAEAALFLGCVARLADQSTLTDTLFVLRSLGFRIHIPRTQRCCGALDRHRGEAAAADSLARRNLAAFNPVPVQHIVSSASGCGAMLSEYHTVLPEDPDAAAFSVKVIDVNALILDLLPPALPALRARIVIHEPCSSKFPLRQSGTVAHLLSRVPGLELLSLPPDLPCCGAAGAYHLLHRENAEQLRRKTLARIEALKPDMIVSANVGCAMFLRAGLAHTAMKCDVLHPVSLIARQLRAVTGAAKDSHAATHGD